jgi:hypothetical protein
MKTKKLTLLLTITLLSISCLADVYKGSEDVRPDGKKTIVRQHERHGALLPFKTHNNDWDGIDRPGYWNGYGVSPQGSNYWYYYNEETECYPGYDSVWVGTDHCKKESPGDPDDVKQVQEPGLTLMLGFGCLVLWMRINRKV